MRFAPGSLPPFGRGFRATALRHHVDWYQRHATGTWLAVALLLGTLQAVAFRYSMNPDGIAYLDMGDAYLRGDWTTAIRSHWSPLYAWLLAGGLRTAAASPTLEFPVAHVVNLMIYGLALGTFSWLLHEVLATLRELAAALPPRIGPPEWAWISLGYAIFIWCTLEYLPIGLLTPDLLVSALVYAICAVMLRMRPRPTWRGSVLFGGLLGLGYLAKAPMLPLGVVFLGASTIGLGGCRPKVVHLIISCAALAAVAVPFIIVLSVANGRPTIGDSARLNYLWVIDGTPLVHWQGGPDGIGQPLHHSQLVLEQPATYAFDSPFLVTYAPWYAPEYWFTGATPIFMLRGQLRAILAAVQAYSSLVVDLGAVFASLVSLLSMHTGPWRLNARPLVTVFAPALAAFGLYALVLVEARYLAPFVVLLILGLFMLVRLPDARWSAVLIARVSVVVVSTLLLQIGWSTSGAIGSIVAEARQGRLLEPDDQALVALALRSAGVAPGEPVASGNRAFNDYWARLARVRIVAEVSNRESAAVLDADPAARTAVQQVLFAQPVGVVVARAWPAQTGDPRWHPIQGTDYFYGIVP